MKPLKLITPKARFNIFQLIHCGRMANLLACVLLCITFLGGSASASPIVVNVNNAGPGSLRRAIADATSGDTISFDNSLSGQTIVLTSGQLAVTNNLSIDVSTLASGITINGNINDRIFEFAAYTTNTLTGVTLLNGLASGSAPDNYGGAIYLKTYATLTVSNCLFSGNAADFGGGIFNDNFSTLTIESSTIVGNSAIKNGGGIFNQNGIFTINNSTVSSTTANNGGGIYNNSGTSTIEDTTLLGNSAITNGGAIYNYHGASTITNSTISGNSADYGGGVYNNNNTSTIESSTLSGNTATNDGGGIYNYLGTHLIRNSTFVGNSASSGGGNYNSGSLTIDNSTFSGNSASSEGGGIVNWGSALAIDNSTFSGNSASRGGGIQTEYFSAVTLNNATVSGNSATNYGGGIAGGVLGDQAFYITNSIIAGNTASANENIGVGIFSFTVISAANNITSGDPKLAPLGDYGGLTKTRPPKFGSPAIDAGMNTGSLPSTDQRGMPRILAGGPATPPKVDIGAVEYSIWLAGADLSGVDTNNLYLPPGTVYDSATQFPPGFDPSAAGLSRVMSQGEIDDLVVQGQSEVTNNPEVFGLYTESAFKALALDRPFLSRNPGSGKFTLTLGLLQSPNLSTTFSNLTGFTTIPHPVNGKVDIQFDPPSPNAHFFEVYGAEPSP